MTQTLVERLQHHPVIASLYGLDKIELFMASPVTTAIVANVELRKLQAVVELLMEAGKQLVINIDSCEGISPDKGGVDYLADIGVTCLLSTRVATLQRAQRAGLETVQKVFVTDRSTWPRSVKALEQSMPDLVQLMPAPMLAHIPTADRGRLPPVLASGFVCNTDDARAALRLGAVAVSSSNSELWRVAAGELRPQALRA